MSGINNPPASVVSAFAAPAFTLGTSNVEGSAATAVRSDATILTYDATVPVTQAFADAAAAGAAAVAARRDHRHGMMADPAGLVFQARDVTEFTTTSTSKVTTATLTMSLAADVPIYIFSAWRKTSGAASGVNFYIDLNSTQMIAVTIGSTTNQAENGMIRAEVGGRVSNYLRNSMVWTTNRPATGQNQGPLSSAVDMPTVTITQVLFSCATDSASQTVGMDESYAYSLATS